MNLEQCIFLGGLLHFSILTASALVPRVLKWKTALSSLDTMPRRIFWVYGAFIVLMIVGFGTLSVLFAADLASGSPLARGVCGFIAIFWGMRLLVQFFVFDATPYLKSWFLKVGYHALTIAFTLLTALYTLAAFQPEWLTTPIRY